LPSGSSARLDGTGATVLVNGTAGIGRLVVQSGTIAGRPSLTVSGSGQVSLPTDYRFVADLTALAIEQATGSKLDIGKGRLNIAIGGISATDLRADIVSGRSTGSFSGTSGIVTTGGKASVGSANPVVGYRVFTSGSAIVAWAAFGDANLDGQVNSTDIQLINSAARFNTGTNPVAVWVQGDFNYSNGVTSVDIQLLNGAALFNAGSYLPTTGPASLSSGGFGEIGKLSRLSSGSLVASVPEPGTWAMALAGLAVAGAAVRRVRPRGFKPRLGRYRGFTPGRRSP